MGANGSSDYYHCFSSNEIRAYEIVQECSSAVQNPEPLSWSVKAHISYQSVQWRLTAVKGKRERMPLAEITQFSVFTTGESLGA